LKAQAEKEERLKKLLTSKQNVMESKRSLVDEVREEKRRLNAVVNQGRSAAEQQKYERAQEVREKKRRMLEEKERQRQEREDMALKLYKQKMEIENKRKKEAELLMTRLENEEKALISRLRKTQDLQEQVM
jgi:hypothetical protein